MKKLLQKWFGISQKDMENQLREVRLELERSQVELIKSTLTRTRGKCNEN